MPVIGKRFALHAWQGKEGAYVRALKGWDYEPVAGSHANVLFGLYDQDRGGVTPYVEQLARLKRPVFLYPHSARPMIQYDGMYTPNKFVKCMFTHAPGGKEIMERIGYPHPVEVVGWSFCKPLPFVPVKEVKNILFAPIHPNHNGYTWDGDLETNRRTFERLAKYCREAKIKLTVRHIDTLARNGLQVVQGVHYIQAKKENGDALRMMDDYDLIVGHQTFAYMAVARGKPVLMMGEDVRYHSGASLETVVFAASEEKYRDYLTFPLDVLQGDLAELVERARKKDKAVEEWKAKFIGERFQPDDFVERLESYL